MNLKNYVMLENNTNCECMFSSHYNNTSIYYIKMSLACFIHDNNNNNTLTK